MRGLCLFLLLWWAAFPAFGTEVKLPEQVEQLWDAADAYGVSPEENLDSGLDKLLTTVEQQGTVVFRDGLASGAKLLCVVMLCGIAEGGCVGKSALGVTRLAGALAVTTLSVGSVDAMIGLGRETVGTIHDFSMVLLPAAAVLTAATGHVSAAAARQGATVLFAQLLLQVIDQLLIPFVYAYVACACAYAAMGNEGLKKLGVLLKGGITGVLTIIMLVFVAYLTVTGTVAGSVDAAAVKAAKMAISRAVPVVGGILSDAAETVLAGTGILRGSVGVVGLLVVLTICVGPFLHLATHYLTYKLIAAISGTVAEPRLSGLLDSIGGAFGLVLGMTGACALLLLISLVSAVTAVTG